MNSEHLRPQRIVPLLIGGGLLAMGVSGFLLAAGFEHSPWGVVTGALSIMVLWAVVSLGKRLFASSATSSGYASPNPLEADAVHK